MNRTLVLVGVAALVGAVALWFILHTTDGPPSTPRSQGSAVVATTDPRPTPSDPTPSLPAGSDQGSAAGSGESNPRDYMVGDIRVRDHRSGDNKPLDIPPGVHPAESRMIPSSLTHDITKKVKAVMAECTADVPREARGASPRLEGQLVISIKDQTLTVAKATMQLRDIVGAAQEPTKQCIEQKTVGLQTPATDEPDLENYSITITFAIL
jgi:hypothetical protein